MSKLVHSLLHYSKKSGKSHLTLEARNSTAFALALFMDKSPYQIQDVNQLKAKHISDFINSLKLDGLSVRTIQNKASHIREFLRAAGKQAFADSEIISNKTLGISGGSRLGSKRASTEVERRAAIDKATELGRHGLASVIELTYVFGLRRLEAISASEDILKKWKSELKKHGYIEVFKGTKGGRRRNTPALNIDLALQILDRAIKISKTQGGYLIPASDLKQAVSSYRNFMAHHGFVGHCHRYAYAVGRVDAYICEGHSKENALIKTSQDLGHGDGRGRWINSVYCKPT